MRLIHAIERLIYPIFRINWAKYFKLKNKNSEIVVISSFKTNKKFKSEIFAWELGFIKELIDQNLSFDYIKLNFELKNKIIFWSPHIHFFDLIKFDNYPNTLSFFAKQFENQNNKIFVSSNEILFLENKYFMHQELEKKGIKTPRTWLYENKSEIDTNDLEFPLLYKENHSSSGLGLHLFKDRLAFEKFKFPNKIVLQKLMNIRKDMRVTIIGGQVISSFWRINVSDRWMPTSTKNGSSVKFEKISKRLEKYVLDVVDKLKMDICGMDIAFEDDDTTKEPLVLEVSPRFSQNPNYDTTKMSFNYGEYKKISFQKNSFRYLQTKTHMEYAQKYVRFVLNKKNQNKY
jgi:glutathione synthase/RimK-type ligase-like ATP-grasp enzyme